nr:MAG TPA: hypothetical protein [Caudoviricetes sp.]
MAKGCDERLKDNPYLEFNETDIQDGDEVIKNEFIVKV